MNAGFCWRCTSIPCTIFGFSSEFFVNEHKLQGPEGIQTYQQNDGGSSGRKQFASYKRHATNAPYITREFRKNLMRRGLFLASLLASLSGSLVGAWISETRLEPRHEAEGGL
jgi:hypothetical protein